MSGGSPSAAPWAIRTQGHHPSYSYGADGAILALAQELMCESQARLLVLDAPRDRFRQGRARDAEDLKHLDRAFLAGEGSNFGEAPTDELAGFCIALEEDLPNADQAQGSHDGQKKLIAASGKEAAIEAEDRYAVSSDPIRRSLASCDATPIEGIEQSMSRLSKGDGSRGTN